MTLKDDLIKEYVNCGSLELCNAHFLTRSCKELYSGKTSDEIVIQLREDLDACNAANEIIFRRMENAHYPAYTEV